MPDYAIIIPAFNEEAFLPATLSSARSAMTHVARDFGKGELIVVDNNSHDRTAEVARSHGADQVVFEPHNQIARARNAGAESTTAEWLVFLDADTTLSGETLAKALAALATGTVAAGGARVAMDREVTPLVGWIVRTWDRVSTTFAYAAGSFFFTRRDAFKAGGGFDETVYAGEEVWLARRIKAWAKKEGLTFHVLPESVTTSARKDDWFSTKEFLTQLAVIFLIPWATRSRRLCAMWYKRPKAPTEPS